MRRIYHYHIKKCGGTTMNSWLDTLSNAARTCDPAWRHNGDLDWYMVNDQNVAKRSAINFGRAIFHWSDVVHSHIAYRRFAPPDVFSFTMVRDPVRRLISQVTDWRRLHPSDYVAEPREIQQCIADSRRLSVSALLAQYGQGIGRMMFDNHLTRALAATRLGWMVHNAPEARDLLADALLALHADYEFVGIAEAFDLSRNALCRHLGLPPAGPSPRLNMSAAPGDASGPAIDLSAAEIDHYTGCDRIIYDAARKLFDTRDRALAAHYDHAAFERDHAAALLSGLRGRHENAATRYHVREPFYGAGFHGRDGGRDGDNAVWTGPQIGAELYIPVPAFMPVSLLLWIRGYARPDLREGIKIMVNGAVCPYRFEHADAYADLLVVDAFSTTGFLRLAVETTDTLPTDDTPGTPQDMRRRGISFDAYGWRPLERAGCEGSLRSLDPYAVELNG